MKRLAPLSLAIGLSLIAAAPSRAIEPVTPAEPPPAPPTKTPPANRSNPTYFDFNCQPQAEKGNDGLVFGKKFPLTIAKQAQILYTAYHPDGSPVVCLAKSDFTEAKLIEKLPIEFLESAQADPRVPNGFIFASANGNGLELAIRHWGLIFKTAQPEVIDLNLGIHSGKLKPKQSVKHAFKGKAGQSIAIKLDSRAQARFTVINSKGARIITGTVSDSPAISRANFTLPANDTYQAIVTSTRNDEIQGYTLSINLNQIPLNR